MPRALAGLALWLAGCAAAPERAPFVPVSRQEAVLRWQKGGAAQIRDAVIERSGNGAMRLTVASKNRPRIFLLETNGELDAPGWRGPSGAAPPDLVVWASFLTICQNAARLPVGERELHTPAARVAVNKTSDGLKSVSILNTDAAETVSVAFR